MSRKNEPKPYQYKNLTYVDRKPAFLANAYAALSGSRQPEGLEILDPSRPAIPVRPGGDEDDGPVVVGEDEPGRDKGKARRRDEDEEEDGDEAPQVVVLKEGRHLTQEQVDEERVRARERPDEAGAVPSSKKPSVKPSLNFASSNGTGPKRRRAVVVEEEEEVGGGGEGRANWNDMVKKVKGSSGQTVDEGVKAAIAKAQKEAGTSKSRAEVEREEKERREGKRAKKEQRRQKEKKARGLMSFEE